VGYALYFDRRKGAIDLNKASIKASASNLCSDENANHIYSLYSTKKMIRKKITIKKGGRRLITKIIALDAYAVDYLA
jgi:hypothetical protein